MILRNENEFSLIKLWLLQIYMSKNASEIKSLAVVPPGCDRITNEAAQFGVRAGVRAPQHRAWKALVVPAGELQSLRLTQTLMLYGNCAHQIFFLIFLPWFFKNNIFLDLGQCTNQYGKS